MKYSIEITETEDMALSFAAVDQQAWITNAVHNRCRVAIDEIVKIAVEKFIAAGEPTPASKEEIVFEAFDRGWVKTAKQVNEEFSKSLEN